MVPLVLLLGLSASCTSEIREASKSATTGATEAMAEPQTRREALSALETPETRRAVSDLAATAGAAAFDAALRRARTEAPIVREVTRTEVAPSMSDILSSPEVRAAMASLAVEMSREAVIGANDATIELSRSKPKKGLLAHASAIFSEGGAVAVVGAIVLALIILALAIGLVRAHAKLTRLRAARATA